MRTRFAVLGAAVAGLLLLGAGATGAQTSTRVVLTFATPGVSSFTVPTGICQVAIDARGAQGGSATLTSGPVAAMQARANAAHQSASTPATVPPGFPRKGVGAADAAGAGGRGGETIASLPVTPGESLVVSVGAAGTPLGGATQPTRGAPDGGNGGSGSSGDGAGGGGSSDVRQAGSDLAHRVVVAGGGGGGSTGFFFLIGPFLEEGGAGGGSTGGNGDPASPTNTGAGQGAKPGAGGAGGIGGMFGTSGGNGSLGQGGAGANSTLGDPPGGGGGGGLYGGGGGSSFDLAIPPLFGGDAGGGGSGFGPAGATLTSGVNSGNGSVTISYDPATSGCVAAAVIVAPRFTG